VTRGALWFSRRITFRPLGKTVSKTCSFKLASAMDGKRNRRRRRKMILLLDLNS
jgi:hypothetical protein